MSGAGTESPFDAKPFLGSLGARPGVYVFYGADGKALYVGKAANLKSRVSSYFRSSGLSAKTRPMVSKIHRAEIQQTRNDICRAPAGALQISRALSQRRRGARNARAASQDFSPAPVQRRFFSQSFAPVPAASNQTMQRTLRRAHQPAGLS